MQEPAPESFQHYSGKIVCIKKYIYPHEAQVANGVLNGHGIDCYVAADDAGGLRPDQNFLMGIRLMVKETDAEQAIELLGKDD